MATRITLKDAGAHFGKLSEKKKAAAMRGLLSAAHRGVQVVVSEIIPAAVPQPVDRGPYRAGWKVLPFEDKVFIVNFEPHAPHIEKGVRAAAVKIGRKMIDALTEWARRHGFEEPERAAWAIAKKMKKRGIWSEKGLGILTLLNDRLRTEIVREEVEREMRSKK